MAPGKTVLVTGGAGYIGSHTCKRLAAAGWNPVVFDNLVYGHEDFAKWGPLEQGDLADTARIEQVLLRHRPAAVIHFAAYAYVGESMTDPAKYYRSNVAGTLNLLELLKHNNIRSVVFSSTCATYGNPERLPINEEHPQRPINPYGATKLAVERMLADFDAAYGMRSIALRYFNAAGADPEGEIGEDHTPESHLIPLVLSAAAGRTPGITVFGNDYDTPDGTCVRDYIHVTDLAEAHLQALEYLERGGGPQRLNLGTGHGYSVREVIEAAQRVTGRPIPVRMDTRRPGDPATLVADPAMAKAILGWQPNYTDIETILTHAWNWHQKRWDTPEH